MNNNWQNKIYDSIEDCADIVTNMWTNTKAKLWVQAHVLYRSKEKTWFSTLILNIAISTERFSGLNTKLQFGRDQTKLKTIMLCLIWYKRKPKISKKLHGNKYQTKAFIF